MKERSAMKEKKHSSVYMLTGYSIKENADSKPLLLSDGVSVKLWRSEHAVFTSVKKAENAIAKIAECRAQEIEKGWQVFKHFGFTLIEHYVDDPFYSDGSVCSFRSYRTYLPDGKLNYFSDTDEACTKKFRGTSIPSRFSRGDFAWILCGVYASPTLIEAEPYSKLEWKKKFKAGLAGDFTDDSGIDFPLNSNGHDHTFAPLLFPVSKDLHIPEEAKMSMRASQRNWLNYGR